MPGPCYTGRGTLSRGVRNRRPDRWRHDTPASAPCLGWYSSPARKQSRQSVATERQVWTGSSSSGGLARYNRVGLTENRAPETGSSACVSRAFDKIAKPVLTLRARIDQQEGDWCEKSSQSKIGWSEDEKKIRQPRDHPSRSL